MSYLLFLAVLLLAAIATLALRIFGVRIQTKKVFEAIAVAVSWLPILLMHSFVVFMIAFGPWMVAALLLYATGLLQYVEIPNVSARHIVISLALLAVAFSLFVFLRARARAN